VTAQDQALSTNNLKKKWFWRLMLAI
jgi:hypothetical protein